MWESIIGVAGTLLGTLLGWVLATIKIGRLKIGLSNIKNEKYYRQDTERRLRAQKVGEVYSYAFEFQIKLYNTSEKTKVMRELEVVFYDDKKKELFAEKVKNLGTERVVNKFIYQIDEFGVMNLGGFSGVDLNAKVSTGNIENLYKTKSIYLRYKKGNFHIKKKKIQDFGENLEPRVTEMKEKQNG